MTASKVAAVHPLAMQFVLAKLHAACPLTVPLYTIFSKGKLSQDEWMQRLGYRCVRLRALDRSTRCLGHGLGHGLGSAKDIS